LLASFVRLFPSPGWRAGGTMVDRLQTDRGGPELVCSLRCRDPRMYGKGICTMPVVLLKWKIYAHQSYCVPAHSK